MCSKVTQTWLRPFIYRGNTLRSVSGHSSQRIAECTKTPPNCQNIYIWQRNGRYLLQKGSKEMVNYTTKWRGTCTTFCLYIYIMKILTQSTQNGAVIQVCNFSKSNSALCYRQSIMVKEGLMMLLFSSGPQYGHRTSLST